MSAGPLGRLAAFFVAPVPAVAPARPRLASGGDGPRPEAPVLRALTDDEAATEVSGAPMPASLAIVGDGPGVAPFAEACGRALVRRHRARTGLLLLWPPPDRPRRAPAARGPAGRLAAALEAAGHAVRGNGVMVIVDLPEDDAQAAAEAERARAVAGAVPVVLVLAGPRGPALDRALADHDRIAVALAAAAPEALRRIAVDAVRARAPGSAVCEVAPPAARGLPAGVAAAVLRRAVAATLGDARAGTPSAGSVRAVREEGGRGTEGPLGRGAEGRIVPFAVPSTRPAAAVDGTAANPRGRPAGDCRGDYGSGLGHGVRR